MIRRFDNKIERIIAHLRNPLATRFFLSVTHLGGPIAITLLTCTLLILLLVSEEVNLAKGLIVAVAGSALLDVIVKYSSGRVRPRIIKALTVELTPSFPSGHTIATTTLYGFSAYVFCILFPASSATTLVVASAVGIILAVSLSRLYLGVHYTTDILAGYVVGVVFIFLGIKVAMGV